MHAHFHYISQRLLSTKISLSFHSSLVHNEGDLLGSMLFALFHLWTFHPTTTAQFTCVSFVGKWYTHSWSSFRCVVCFFAVIGKVWHIRTFSAVDKVCQLVSIGVRPVYIISSMFFYTEVRSSYSRCPNGFFAILWSPSYQMCFTRTLAWLLAFLCSQIFKQFLRCFHFVMPSSQAIYNVLYFHHQISYNIILSLMFVP
jgi:hypothetical protein